MYRGDPVGPMGDTGLQVSVPADSGDEGANKRPVTPGDRTRRAATRSNAGLFGRTARSATRAVRGCECGDKRRFT